MLAWSDFPRKFPVLFLALILGFAGAARGEESAVSVEQPSPQIVRRTYDPLNPPAEMLLKLKLPEAGLCQSDFGCGIRIGTDYSGFGLQTARATVTSVQFITHLNITIWTVTESTPKLLAHEEVHREICEYYYRQAREVALALGRRALGTRLTIAPPSDRTTVLEARETLQNKLLAEFLRETAERSIVANDLYDTITAHGANQIAEADAVAQALAEERARLNR